MDYKAEQIRVSCSYCGVIIRDAQDQTSDVVTSHGICLKCAGKETETFIRCSPQGGANAKVEV